MRFEKDLRALICYAGSAPEASIGSKPMGSELVVFICTLIAKSQHFVEWVTPIFAACFPISTPHSVEKTKQFTLPILPLEGDKIDSIA